MIHTVKFYHIFKKKFFDVVDNNDNDESDNVEEFDLRCFMVIPLDLESCMVMMQKLILIMISMIMMIAMMRNVILEGFMTILQQNLILVMLMMMMMMMMMIMITLLVQAFIMLAKAMKESMIAVIIQANTVQLHAISKM